MNNKRRPSQSKLHMDVGDSIVREESHENISLKENSTIKEVLDYKTDDYKNKKDMKESELEHHIQKHSTA